MAAIIFDFDGTIADSFDYVADFLAAEAGIKSLDQIQKQQLRQLSMLAMARQLGHRWWHMPKLFIKGRQRMARSMGTLEPFVGMPEVIEKLHAQGHELFIVSSNSVRNIRKFLHRHSLHTYFLEVYGGIGHFSKAPLLRKLLREHSLLKKTSIYVGDELRDIEASQSLDLAVIAVTWGFAKPADLQAAGPTHLATTPEKLLNLLEEF